MLKKNDLDLIANYKEYCNKLTTIKIHDTNKQKKPIKTMATI